MMLRRHKAHFGVVCAAIVALFFSFQFDVPSIAANLLQNGGFEAGKSSWYATNATFDIVSAPVHSGGAAARLIPIVRAPCSLRQFVPIAAGASYALSGWGIKNSSEVQYLQLALQWQFSDGTYSATFPSSRITGISEAYVRMALGPITAPAGAVGALIWLQATFGNDTPAVYFDDIAFEMVSPPPSATPSLSPTPTATFTPSSTRTSTATRTPTPSATPTALPAGVLVINEICYYPAARLGAVTPEARREWIELFNRSPHPLTLVNWTIDDGEERDLLPPINLAPGEVGVIAGSTAAFLADYSDLASTMVVQVADGSLGNGLANVGDSVALFDSVGRLVDAMSFGSERAYLDPPCPLVQPGHSLEREPAGYDSDSAADFVDRYPPSPGRLWLPSPSPTATSSSTPTPSPTFSPTVIHKTTNLPLLIRQRSGK